MGRNGYKIRQLICPKAYHVVSIQGLSLERHLTHKQMSYLFVNNIVLGGGKISFELGYIWV